MKRTLRGLILMAVGLVGIGFLLPSTWKVQRSVVIDAPPGIVYSLVANFKTGWDKWSAFDHEDPTIQYTYSGPNQGVGATRSWTSQKMGNGTQKITQASRTSGIEFTLEMERPRCALNGRMAFEPSGVGTKVTWTDWGEAGNNPFKRYMGAMMDSMMGKTFERSLAALKKEAEARGGQR